MTKRELLRWLEPFDGDIRIAVQLPALELPIEKLQYVWDNNADPNSDAHLVIIMGKD